MNYVSFGDQARNFSIQRNISVTKQRLYHLSQELGTGIKSDIAASLQGNLGPLNALESSLSQMEIYKNVQHHMVLMTQAMQISLGKFNQAADDVTTKLLGVGNDLFDAKVIGPEAQQRFKAAVGALNEQVGGRTLFAGQEIFQSPLPDGEAFLTLLEGVVAGKTQAVDIDAALTAWFDSPAGYGALYKGGAALADQDIGGGEKASVTITAQHQTIRNSLKSLAMGALIDRNLPGVDGVTQKHMARLAGEGLLAAQSPRIALQAGLGLVEQQIAKAQSYNSAEKTALEIARNALIEADPYETGVKLKETETQLATIFTLTERLSRLNLVNFLK